MQSSRFFFNVNGQPAAGSVGGRSVGRSRSWKEEKGEERRGEESKRASFRFPNFENPFRSTIEVDFHHSP